MSLHERKNKLKYEQQQKLYIFIYKFFLLCLNPRNNKHYLNIIKIDEMVGLKCVRNVLIFCLN